jgi:hypothetical protein
MVQLRIVSGEKRFGKAAMFSLLLMGAEMYTIVDSTPFFQPLEHPRHGGNGLTLRI